MNDHPNELLPAFVLGALDADEATRVAQHLNNCPDCSAEVNEFRATVAMLPYQADLRDPPASVKRQLMARISADLAERPAAPASPPRPVSRSPWITRAATALSLALTLMLAFVTVDTRRQLNEASAQLSEAQQSLSAAQEETARQQQTIAALQDTTEAVTTFIAAPATIGQPLQTHHEGAEAKMYMQPGHNRVVLVVAGLPELEPGKAYQFWFAVGDEQVPSETFRVNEDGLVEVVIDAPLPVDSYAQVMVTVEEQTGSTSPSPNVILEAEL